MTLVIATVLIIMKNYEKVEPMQIPELWGMVTYIRAPLCPGTLQRH